MKINTSLFWGSFFCIATCSGQVIAPGVVYEKTVFSSPVPLVIHELQVNPSQAKLVIEASHKTCTGSEKTSSMAKRNNAIAAINGGFFTFGASFWGAELIRLLELFGYEGYNAFPVCALSIDKRWFSLSTKSAGIIGWKNGGQDVVAGEAETVWLIKIGDRFFPVADLNKPIAKGPMVYTSDYGENTPKNSNVMEILVKNGFVVTKTSGGGTCIPCNCYVYACDVETNDTDIEDFVQVGDAVSIVRQYKSPDAPLGARLEEMDYIVAAAPLLIKNGAITPVVEQSSSFLFTRLYPKTAVGVRADGTWLLLVVDGRQKDSEGISIKDLAIYMQRRGCMVALNLDGGAASTMVIGDQVVNSPAGRKYAFVKKEIPIADAILVMPR